MKILYFTGTGNNLYVSKKIGGELLSIPRLLKEKQFDIKGEAVGIVVPCYYFTVPYIVKEYLEQITIEADYVFTIMTYGKMMGGGLNPIEKILKRKGVEVDYSNKIQMIDNFLPNFEMEQQLKTEGAKTIETQIKTIVTDIQNRKKEKKRIGLFQKTATTLFGKMIFSAPGRKRIQKTSAGFYVTDACTSCRICQEVCPRGNVDQREKIETKPGPKFGNRCESCLACIHLCPENAIHLKSQKSSVRFKNRNVTTAEIIAANSQN